MFTFKSKGLSAAALAAALATALVAGCGSGGGDSGGGQPPSAAADPATSAQGVVDFLLALIRNETSDLTEPKPIETIVLATEELAEPSPVWQ